MKFNDKELATMSLGPAVIEGRLHHKKLNSNFAHSGFKEKWFKLKANILFYFNLSETGLVTDAKPAGVIIMENAFIQYEMHADVPFAFSVLFHDDLDKKHLFAGRSEANVNQWVSCLKQSSYEYWRAQLLVLQTKISIATGSDPLLMFPRNSGSRLVPVSRSTPKTPSPSPKPKLPKQSTFCSYIEPDLKMGDPWSEQATIQTDPRLGGPWAEPTTNRTDLKMGDPWSEQATIRTDMRSVVPRPDPTPVRPPRSRLIPSRPAPPVPSSPPNLIDL